MNKDYDNEDIYLEKDLPAKDKKRAERRAARQRMVNRVKRFAKYIWNWDTESQKYCKLADNIKKCDCWRCNKQRERFGPKFSEVKQLEKFPIEEKDV